MKSCLVCDPDTVVVGWELPGNNVVEEAVPHACVWGGGDRHAGPHAFVWGGGDRHAGPHACV